MDDINKVKMEIKKPLKVNKVPYFDIFRLIGLFALLTIISFNILLPIYYHLNNDVQLAINLTNSKENVPLSTTSINSINLEQYQHDHSNFYYYTIKSRSSVDANQLAINYGLTFIGKVGELENYFLLKQSKPLVLNPSFNSNKIGLEPVIKFNDKKRINRRGSGLTGIEGFELQIPRKRVKRAAIANGEDEFREGMELNMTRYQRLGIEDPGFGKQWHFHNQWAPTNDLNVVKLWEEGITGKGVVVAIVDDGIDYEHRDIKENFFAEGSYDFNDKKPLPMPMLPEDTHGTRCAGQIAGIRNDACGVGIAFNAKVSGIRVLSKEISDDAEASAINYQFHLNHVYSCSWGPPDDGLAMDRPPKIVEDAIENGVRKGRDGKGTVFVFASGNGGFKGDNCNFDGYTNSIYSITVGSIDGHNQHPGYSEACTALLISAYSSGVSGPRIYTSSSWNNQCTDSHGGTSAAAPMVAGIIALALEIRPDLTWRDFQHISVRSAVPVDTKNLSWDKTGAGRWYSPLFGYGKIDGYKFVHYAKNFTSVNSQTKLITPIIKVNTEIPQNPDGISSTLRVTRQDLAGVDFKGLEHVQVTVHIVHDKRSDLAIQLMSPNGIISELAHPRRLDDSPNGFPNWTFMSVKHWDENPEGDWVLRVIDIKDPFSQGSLLEWSMTLWGESTIPSHPTNPNLKPNQIKEPTQSKIIEIIRPEIKKVKSNTKSVNNNTEERKPIKVNNNSSISSSSSSSSSKDNLIESIIDTSSKLDSLTKTPSIKTKHIDHLPEPSTKLKNIDNLPEPSTNPTLTSPQINPTATHHYDPSEIGPILESYHPGYLMMTVILLSIIVLTILATTLIYRYRNRHYYNHQQREMSLLSDDQEYQLNDIDNDIDDDDINTNNNGYQGVYQDDTQTRNTVSEVVFVADDEAILEDMNTPQVNLLDINEEEGDELGVTSID